MRVPLIATLLLAVTAARATEIVVEPVQYASQLSGKVVDPTGAPISDVSVELVPCGSGEFKGHFLAKESVLAHTDKNGQFVIHSWHHEGRTCVSFSREGFNYQQFELKYKPTASPLVVKLTIAA